MSDFTLNTTFKDHQEYLEKRGIDQWTRDKLNIVSVGPTKLKELGFKWPEFWYPQSALLIPANSITGEEIGYGARLFYQKTFGEDSRAKYLSQPTEGKRPPSLHFTPLANWEKLEYGQRIFIAESYIKANILGKLGYHAIGVSGVNGWSFHGTLNRQLSDFDWRTLGLRPVVLMDSNVTPDRPDLWGAVKRLQAAMDSLCGVTLEIISLPWNEKKEQHWGLDDYAAELGESALKELCDGESEKVPSELDAHLVQLNSEVCIIRDIGKFADIERNILMGKGQFEDVNYADRRAMTPDEKMVPVAKIWTQWHYRNIVDTLRYKPGKERLVRDEDQSYFNLWRGWGVEPIEDDTSYFTEWVCDAFSSEVERTYFLDWWSYQLQNPGIKLNTALMLVGPSGVGKGWMAAIVERIFGSDNTWKCNLSDLESRFNSGLGAAQVLVIEEADIAGGVKVYNTLKDLITNEHLRYERKGVDAVKLDNCLNIFMNSNHIGVLALDEFDRRFAVLEITNQSIANDLSYWEPRWEWLRCGGASSIFHFLLAREISKSFNPYGEAPWTQAKEDMIESTHEPMDRWVYEHVILGEPIYVKGTEVDGNLMSAKELAFLYYEGNVPIHEVDRRQSMQMVKALNNARARVANGGKKIKYQGTPTKYYWVGRPGLEQGYQDILDNRLFFRRLVASVADQVASNTVVATPEGKF